MADKMSQHIAVTLQLSSYEAEYLMRWARASGFDSSSGLIESWLHTLIQYRSAMQQGQVQGPLFAEDWALEALGTQCKEGKGAKKRRSTSRRKLNFSTIQDQFTKPTGPAGDYLAQLTEKDD